MANPDIDLDALEALLAKATPGPWARADWERDGGPNRWTIEGQQPDPYASRGPGYTSVWPGGIQKMCVADVRESNEPEANGDLIVALHNNAPAMIAALRARQPTGDPSGAGGVVEDRVEAVARAMCLKLERQGDTERVEQQRVDRDWRDYVRYAEIAVATLTPSASNSVPAKLVGDEFGPTHGPLTPIGEPGWHSPSASNSGADTGLGDAAGKGEG